MASLTWWTWVCVNSGSWWWTGRPGMLRFMASQRVGHDWATELNWTEWYFISRIILCVFYEFLFAYVIKLKYNLWWILTIQNVFKMPYQYYTAFPISFANSKSSEWKTIFNAKTLSYVLNWSVHSFFRITYSWQYSHLCWNTNFEVTYLQQCMCLKYWEVTI